MSVAWYRRWALRQDRTVHVALARNSVVPELPVGFGLLW